MKRPHDKPEDEGPEPKRQANDHDDAGPKPKRQAISSAHKTRSSALLRPVRTIGVITTSVPFALQKLGKTDFAAVSVGKQIHVYDLKNLRILFVSPALTEKVRALLWIGETILTSLKNDIVIFHKLTEIARLVGHRSSPRLLMSIGGSYVVSSTGKETLVWNVADLELLKIDNSTGGGQGEVSPAGRLEVQNVVAICHPPTYLNKVLVASEDGQVHLFNVRTLKRIHTFNLPKHGAITTMVAAPSDLDIVAVGYASGHICIINAKTDTVLMTFTQSEGAVVTLSFRSDGHPNLVSGSPKGDLNIWDLEHKSVVQQIEAHTGTISSASFIEGQPLLLSSGHDNSLVMRVFEAADGRCRLLRQRRGFAGAIRRIRFYNEKGLDLICTSDHQGKGNVGRLSTIQQHQNMVFAQSWAFKSAQDWKSLHGKLPGVEDISFAPIRHYDWPCIVSSHANKSDAFLWSATKSALVPKRFAVPNVKGGQFCISCLHVSQCGNYVVIGYDNGMVHRFNVQSARHVGEFTADDKQAHEAKLAVVHILPNLEVVTVGSNEPCVRIWDLRKHSLTVTVPIEDTAIRGIVHGSLLALATHHGVTIVDVMQRHVVRRFPVKGMAFITDMGFSPDGRWLAVSTNEGRLLIFDLPAARCIDTIRFISPALSLAFCPSGAFLFTSHANGKGAVRVWANKMLFDVSLLAVAENKEVRIDEPGEADDSDNEDAAEVDFKFSSSTEPLETGALTLSTMPETQWKNILHLDVIKERNKPISAKSTRRKAPFFLPTAANENAVQKSHFVAEETSDPKSQIISLTAKPKGGDLGHIFVDLLRSQQWDKALEHLMKQTASGAHLCWSELGILAGGDDEDLAFALQFFKHHMDKNHHADLVQTYLSLFLSFHGDVLREGVGDQEVDELLKKQRERWNKTDLQCQKILCFLKMLTQTQAQW